MLRCQGLAAQGAVLLHALLPAGDCGPKLRETYTSAIASKKNNLILFCGIIIIILYYFQDRVLTNIEYWWVEKERWSQPDTAHGGFTVGIIFFRQQKKIQRELPNQ